MVRDVAITAISRNRVAARKASYFRKKIIHVIASEVTDQKIESQMAGNPDLSLLRQLTKLSLDHRWHFDDYDSENIHPAPTICQWGVDRYKVMRVCTLSTSANMHPQYDFSRHNCELSTLEHNTHYRKSKPIGKRVIHVPAYSDLYSWC